MKGIFFVNSKWRKPSFKICVKSVALSVSPTFSRSLWAAIPRFFFVIVVILNYYFLSLTLIIVYTIYGFVLTELFTEAHHSFLCASLLFCSLFKFIFAQCPFFFECFFLYVNHERMDEKRSKMTKRRKKDKYDTHNISWNKN